MPPLAWAIVVAATTMAVQPAAPQGAAAQSALSNASGALVLDGRSTPLTYAYVAAKPGFFDKTKEDITVLLSDVPLSEADRDDSFGLIRLGRSGQAHVVEVVIDADGDPIAGAIYAPIFSGMFSLTGMHVFESERFGGDEVQGTLHTRATHEFDGHTIEYRASFSARVPRPPTPEQVAQAIAGPAGQAARAHLAAILAGDFTAFLGTLSPNAARGYQGDAGRARFDDYRRDMPEDATVVGLLEESPDAATATVQGHEREIVIEYTVTLERRDGRWVVVE
ncbi:MAG: hypothetical protein AB7Q29_05735 [Vicinamibacterales bacterium]